jgi:hypothetical protein
MDLAKKGAELGSGMSNWQRDLLPALTKHSFLG